MMNSSDVLQYELLLRRQQAIGFEPRFLLTSLEWFESPPPH